MNETTTSGIMTKEEAHAWIKEDTHSTEIELSSTVSNPEHTEEKLTILTRSELTDQMNDVSTSTKPPRTATINLVRASPREKLHLLSIRLALTDPDPSASGNQETDDPLHQSDLLV